MIQINRVKLKHTKSHGLNTVSVVQLASTGCFRVKPLFDRQESGLRRLSSLTHRGQAVSFRISIVDTVHAGLLRFRPVVVGGEKFHARRATVMPRNKQALFRSPVSPGCLKIETTGVTSR